MKKITLCLAFLFLSFFSATAQTMPCDSFGVLNITVNATAHTMDVWIYNISGYQVNYPSVMVVDTAAHDTVANKTQTYYFFAQIGHDTLVHTIPTTIDSIVCGVYYAVYFRDNSSHDSCILSYILPCPVGINEMVEKNNELTVFPNPATNLLHISFPANFMNEDEVANVKIVNVLGQVVFLHEESCGRTATGSRQSTISIANLPKGLYFILAEKNNRILTGKLIIE